MGVKTKTSPNRVRATQKRAQAMELRIAGATMLQIATALGVSKTRAFQYVSEGLADLQKEVSDRSRQARDLQVERSKRYLRYLWPAVMQGDARAIHAAVRVDEREAKLLGLDSPDEVTLSFAEEREELIRVLGEVGDACCDACRKLLSDAMVKLAGGGGE